MLKDALAKIDELRSSDKIKYNGAAHLCLAYIREILVALGDDPYPVDWLDKIVALTNRFEDIERRLEDQGEHISDLEHIIRDGEAFDSMNEVIRKLHNRICDLEGYGTKKPSHDEGKVDGVCPEAKEVTFGDTCPTCNRQYSFCECGKPSTDKQAEPSSNWTPCQGCGILTNYRVCAPCFDKEMKAKQPAKVEPTITISRKVAEEWVEYNTPMGEGIPGMEKSIQRKMFIELKKSLGNERKE